MQSCFPKPFSFPFKAAVTISGRAVAAAARKRANGGGVTSGGGRPSPPALQGALSLPASRRRGEAGARRRMLSRLQELRKEEETLLRVKAALHDQLTRLKVGGERGASGARGGGAAAAAGGPLAPSAARREGRSGRRRQGRARAAPPRFWF